MKRLIQLAALLVIGLLVVQPALGGLPCVQGAPVASAPGCPMAMSGMGPGCPMSGMTASSACPQNCCLQSISRTFSTPGAPKELHLSALASPSVLPFPVPAAEPSLTVQTPAGARAASPPQYLLNQVFRI